LLVFMETSDDHGETIKWSYYRYNNIYIDGKRLAVIDKIRLRNFELWYLGITAFWFDYNLKECLINDSVRIIF